MDDPKHGEYSRAPELEDLLQVCAALNKEGARYMLIGGFAMILHGFLRGTKDIDFLIDASPENVRKVKKALACLPDKTVLELRDNDIEQYTVVRVADEIVIDLLAKACGVDYAEASHFMKLFNLENVEIPLAQEEILIRMKDTIRASDKMDVDFLRAKIEKQKI